MARVFIHVRGVDQALELELRDGESVLLGRAPDATRLAPDVPASIATRVVDSAHVSANHCVLRAERTGVTITDTVSRNGTSIRLEPGGVAAVHHGAVQIELAPAMAPIAPARDPEPVAVTASAFAPAVAASVRAWLAAHGLEADVALRDDAGALPSMRLASGHFLGVHPSQHATLDGGWTALADRIAAFVARENARFDEEQGHDAGFVLASPAIREAHRRVFDASVRGHRLLLLGPSGAGKERLAECFHRHSSRADGPFRPVHCGLIQRDLVYTQLFGAVRGAFTGAVRDVVGAVEAANGGTLFLDEVGELELPVQAALLRLLDHRGEFERLGDPRIRHASLHIVAATHRDLREAVARGTFREDLWYRFAGAVVRVPPLRERAEDVAVVLDSSGLALTQEARVALSTYAWPGNFRELESVLQRLASAPRAKPIDAPTVRAALAEGSHLPVTSTPAPVRDASTGIAWTALLTRAMQAFEEDHAGSGPTRLADVRELVEAYVKPLFVAAATGVDARRHGVNHSALARQLDIADGTTVKRLLQRFRERFDR